MITEQGLRASLLATLEFGYKACERGLNLQKAMSDCEPAIQQLIKAAKLPKEVLKVR